MDTIVFGENCPELPDRDSRHALLSDQSDGHRPFWSTTTSPPKASSHLLERGSTKRTSSHNVATTSNPWPSNGVPTEPGRATEQALDGGAADGDAVYSEPAGNVPIVRVRKHGRRGNQEAPGAAPCRLVPANSHRTEPTMHYRLADV